jgi:hypothetical protein
MATTTWAFNFEADNPGQETRELIDLPVDFYLRVKYTDQTPAHPDYPKSAGVKIRLERAASGPDKLEDHDLWVGEPPYYGYGKRVTVFVQKLINGAKVQGAVEITFQAAPF